MRVILFVIALTAGASASAQPQDGSSAAMNANLDRYFAGEKGAAVTFGSTGAVSVVGGIALLATDDELGRGAAYPLLTFGTLHLAVAAVLHFRTDARVDRLQARLATDPAAFRAAEVTRMEGVHRTLDALTAVETLMIAAGASAAVVGHYKSDDLLLGVGVSLAAEAALTLLLDVFAARRATTYQRDVLRFQPGLSVGPSGDPTLLLSLGGAY